MALSLVVAPRAERDLDDIFAFIAAENPRAAARILQEIEAKVFRLTERPFIGPPVHFPKWPGLGKMTSIPYVIFYRPSVSAIEIIRLLHASRDLDTLLATD